MTTRRSPRRRWISVRLTARDVAHDLEQRHSLRWHGLCIGTLTLLGMLLAAWLQKQAGVHMLSVRYAITLAVGYGIYLLVLRWWAARLLDDEEHGSADAGDALDVAAPVLSALGVTGTTTTATTLQATSNEAATGYWIAVPQGSAAPTAAQVKAGVGYGAVTVVAAGNGAMVAAVQRSFSVTGLSPSTVYTLYLVAEDGANNLSTPPSSIDVTTLAPPASAQAIPTLGEWAMLLLTGLMGLGARVALRRR